MGLVPEVMVSPATVNDWLALGYGVDTYGYYRMVILDVDSWTGYSQGHLPGAYYIEDGPADLWSTRSNGVSVDSFQVPTQAQMNEIIRRTNIDGDSIVVITGSRMTSMSRAYFNFRYWGFPRQQLKVLDVTKSGYTAAGYALETKTPPSPKPCQYSVCQIQSQASIYKVRASFQEMLQVAGDNDPRTVVIDSRSSENYAGNPGSTSLDLEESGYVVFEGHIKTAVNQDFRTIVAAISDSNLVRSKDLLSAAMKKIGLDNTMTFFVYNRSGLEASISFLALDAVLNWQVKIYDGGWLQWGQMAGIDASTGGQLEEGSPWRADIPGRSGAINYNKPNGFVVEQKDNYNSYAKQADEINRLDSVVCGINSKGIEAKPRAPGY
jgi:3-mercaptopyruvate sulfurtransferase SseA